VAHLWTLAVEEQFYLVWPLFLFLCPKRWLAGAVASVSVLGFVFGAALSVATADSSAIALLTPTNLTTLGAGALVAILGSAEYGDERLARKLSRAGMILGPPLLALGIAVSQLHLDPRLIAPLRESGSALTFAWAVGRLCVGVPAGLRWALLSRPLRYVGMISYGVYLFHMPLIDLLGHGLYPSLGMTPPDGWRRLVIYGSCAIGLASLSWWLIESRINRWKDRLLVA
jgi:peptidoglycan/LPS O-acetylase OafA/YrhL